jgi:hypothetical protein
MFMANTLELTRMQANIVRVLMVEAGLTDDQAASVIERAQETLKQLPGAQAGPVSVQQRIGTVEAGSSVVGLKVDRIG